MSTIAELCQRRTQETGANRLVLIGIANSTLGAVTAPGKARDIIAHCRERRNKVEPATVLKDVVALRSVLAYAKPGWDMQEITDAPVREAWPVLKAERLVGPARRRKRIALPEEMVRICDYWNASGTSYPMADIEMFQFYSTRRISETTGLLRTDFDADKQTALVRNMKHPRQKEGNDRLVAVPPEACEILLRQPTNTARFFPYNPRVITAMHCKAARALDIDLRLHDLRRSGTTRLLRMGYPLQYILLVTGHIKPDVTMTNYNGMSAEDFKSFRPQA